jgi:hypothetical protein
MEFGEWLCCDVLKQVPHRHFVFSIPKILRRYFLYDRRLLADLSRCAWESLKIFIQESVPEHEPIPGAIIAIQTFGDFLGFNPHCHILVTDGCFYGSKGMFRVAPLLELKKLEVLFRHEVFKILLAKGKIPAILEPDGDSKVFRKNWARLIKKIYEIDPLVCPYCQGSMRIISLCDAIDYVK